jgi:hypothetical protein
MRLLFCVLVFSYCDSATVADMVEVHQAAIAAQRGRTGIRRTHRRCMHLLAGTLYQFQ